MGIAILSGVIDSLDSSSTFRDDFPKWESHTPGTLTPVQSLDDPDNSIPSRFLACVSREETARKLRKIFGDLGKLGSAVEFFVSNNVEPVQNADVVLLWCDISSIGCFVSSTDFVFHQL
jgi:pyrroline-5-carboxylate reductase